MYAQCIVDGTLGQCHPFTYLFCIVIFLQVDANVFFVDYGKVAFKLNYPQAVSDIRVAARYVTK
jgi:hypothetical protein